MFLPLDAERMLAPFAAIFSRPTYARFLTLAAAAALLTMGRRTVSNLLRTAGGAAPGDPSSYRRLLSAARWSGLELGCVLTRMVLDRFIPEGAVRLVGDDTVDGHPGRKVYGKARHRDPVRSSHSYTAWRYGHKWVVLAVLVRLPGVARPWALPIFVDLYRSAEQNQQRRRPHRTPAQIMLRLLRLALLKFPDRRFVFTGDSGYSTHEVARFCGRWADRLTLVGKLHPEANLFLPPPPYSGRGRPRVKGGRLPKPSEAVKEAAPESRSKIVVPWYGGGRRNVAVQTGRGHWFKAGCGLVHLRWVYVADQGGTHRDEYFFTTDPNLTPTAVVGFYCGRWNLETTFQECRSALGLETTRGRCRNTVLRAAPCLFGLYSFVALLFDSLPSSRRIVAVRWRGKTDPTFSDALSAVRRWIWEEGVFPSSQAAAAVSKLPPHVRELLLSALTLAA